VGQAQFSLYSFGGAFANLNRIAYAKIVSYSLIHGIAGRRQADGTDDAAGGENGDISRTATNIDDETRLFIFKIYSRSKCRRQAFVNQIDAPRFRVAGRILDRTPFERR